MSPLVSPLNRNVVVKINDFKDNLGHVEQNNREQGSCVTLEIPLMSSKQRACVGFS